jgi:prepilin-type N-terminal cleavage/methylation domain-containing protein
MCRPAATNQVSPPLPVRVRPRLSTTPVAFTLIELLVVVAIIALLAALLLPALSRAREKAKVTRAHVELYGVGLALQMYSDDTQGRLPPVRVNCNSDLATHWCEFPVELVEQHYLGPGSKPGMAANMEDVFNPNHTYKYAAPGPELLNGAPAGNYQLWVPDDLPTCASTNGQYYSNPKDSPVRWVLWRLGPRPDSPQSQDEYAPMARRSWYRRTGGGGVIARFDTRVGIQFKTP